MPNFESELIKGYAYLLEAPGDQEIPLSGGAQQSNGNAASPPNQSMPVLPQQPPPKESEQTTKTPEGMIMLTDIAKKLFFLNPSDITLSISDKTLLAQPITQTNVEKIIEVLKRIANDQEYPNVS